MKRTHAVVVGGSVAGLCAARVLADAFERVTVLDRDTYPTGALPRAGVPQGRHVHALLARGRQELERLFPGFDGLMHERGALEIDFGWDFATLRGAGWMPRERYGIRTFFASRLLLESVVRELLRRHANVALVEATAAAGLVADGGTVTGVRTECGGTMVADLVVDASGRGSHAPAWLRALGLPAPEETVVDSFAGYSTRWYRAPAVRPTEWWWQGVWIDPTLDPADPLGATAAVLSPIEGGRWIVTVGGLARRYPPTDEAGFLDTLAALRSPLVAEAVRLAEPISPIYGNRAMANRFRHYERWPARLAGFVAVGDAACAFNPVYGQGMTTAALAAGVLATALGRHDADDPALPGRFYRAQAALLHDAWAMATGADFRFAETVGPRPRFAKVFEHYLDALFDAATTDVALRQIFGEVVHMLRPQSALLSPTAIGRVGLHAVRRLAGLAVPATVLAPRPPAVDRSRSAA